MLEHIYLLKEEEERLLEQIKGSWVRIDVRKQLKSELVMSLLLNGWFSFPLFYFQGLISKN